LTSDEIDAHLVEKLNADGSPWFAIRQRAS
jgi:hypothetical protein